MASNIVSLSHLQLPASSRLLPSSWCPDKDLLVVIPRVGNKDRLSLWKMQGSKKWEVDVDSDNTAQSAIVDVTWSPDGLSIAVAHDPIRVTLHSLQDGTLQRTLNMASPLATYGRRLLLTGIWWFQHERREDVHDFPDIFKRAGIITGSAHSLLRTQPLLDPVQDESQPLTATDLFSFQNPVSRASTSKPSLPPVISSWPTLPSDLFQASLKPTSNDGAQKSSPEENNDEIDDSNTDSVLVVADELGSIHCFLDGSYPIGSPTLPLHVPLKSLYKHDDTLFIYPQYPKAVDELTTLSPTVIRLPLLKERIMRDVARVTSSMRELMWYTMRVVKEMRAIWFGSDTQNGARELGPKWLRALETRQQNQFGEEEPHAILDLTCLLATGRSSDSLSDYLGSGEQMSERGIQRWETTMVEALTKLRDFSEKRVAPACQRMHLLLEETYGWSRIPQYAVCQLQSGDIKACLDSAGRAIVIAGWLAATARRELARFKEFMIWLRYESTRATSGVDPHSQPPPKHDILEVNDYLMSGLVVSPIDKWFMGPVPRFVPQDLGVPGDKHDLATAMQRARDVINNPEQMAWQTNVKQKDLSHLDRNLDSLIQELAMRCQKIYSEAASATARSAVMSGLTSAPPHSLPVLQPADADSTPLIRERTNFVKDPQTGALVQHLAIKLPQVGDDSFLCLARIRHDLNNTATAPLASVVILKCCVPWSGEDDHAEGMMPIEVLEADFFDDEFMILVYRIRNREGSSFIAMATYSDLIYEGIQLPKDVIGLTRRTFVLEVTQLLNDGKIGSVPVPIIQSSRLAGCRAGKVSLAVNGRRGRRVACVLDDSGLELEILDMEGEAEEEETDEITTMDA